MNVLVVDDHPVLRRGVRALLDGEEGIGRVDEAGTAEEAVRAVVTSQVDVVVMDLGLPDASGVEATARVLRARPRVAVLVLTVEAGEAAVAACLSAGARGYVLKDDDPEALLDAVRAVHRGALVLGPGVLLPGSTGAGAVSPLDGLSPREREVLAELACGRSTVQIGRRLGVSEKTVRNTLSRVFAALGVADRTQAALLAREHGLGLSA